MDIKITEISAILKQVDIEMLFDLLETLHDEQPKLYKVLNKKYNNNLHQFKMQLKFIMRNDIKEIYSQNKQV